MILFRVLVVIYIVCGCVYWLLQLYLSLRIIKSVLLLEKLNCHKLARWPRVSVIIPARNEAETIERAMQYRLQNSYPNIEILLIDDRSTDRTPEIVDKIAAQDERVKAIHISELPEGWVGKVFALHRGVSQATGDWFLFSDADVHIKPGTLERSIAYCESRKLDHLAIFPELYPINFLVDIVLSVFIRMLCMGARIWAVENEKSNASVGSGSFNLVRRTAFEKTKGFEWLKLEMADDVALGQMLKKSGARSSLINGRGYVGVYFYRSLGEMAIGSERAVFTVIGNFSLMRLVLISLVMLSLEMSPIFALVAGSIPYLLFLGVVMICIRLTTSIIINKWMNRSILEAFFLCIAEIIMAVFILRAGVLGVKRKGIIWRGTFYPTKLLKQGRRYTF